MTERPRRISQMTAPEAIRYEAERYGDAVGHDILKQMAKHADEFRPTKKTHSKKTK